MNYNRDLRSAAYRHFDAAEKLRGANVLGVAGYLYGIAAECAVKQVMLHSGMRPTGEKRDDAFFAHFQPLKTLLRDQASGRLASKLRRIVENSAFMQSWDIVMRYSDGKEVSIDRVDRWRRDADEAIALMDE